MPSAVRFRDSGKQIYDFMSEILVVCPKCAACAQTFRIDAENKDWFAPRRLACGSCGYSKEWAERRIARHWRSSEPRDDYFELPLWLQVSFPDGTLWAYNRDHLELIEAFVTAKLRERRRDPKFGWFNGSIAGRLPKWIQSGKNRDAILRRIDRLKDKLTSATTLGNGAT